MRAAPLALRLALATLALAAPLAAQEGPVVTGAELDAAIEAHSTTAEAQRTAVTRVLDRPEVAKVAGQMGVDLDAARSAAEGMEGATLTRAAAVAAQIEQTLAGGQTFSINATTLIIVLLLIVLVVLIAN